MIYLKSFNLPKDTWVDAYFSPSPYVPKDLPDVYDKLIAECRCMKEGKRFCFYESIITDGLGNKVAKVSFNGAHIS